MVTQGGSNAVTFATGGSDVFNKTGGSHSGTLTLASQGIIWQYKASTAIWYVYSDDLPLSQLKNLFGFSVTTLTDAATIAVNAALGSTFRVTLGGNRTLGTPSNPTDGQKITFEIIQDGTGSRTLAYAAGYSFPSSIGTPVLSSSPGFHDFLAFRYDAGTTTWYCVGFVPQSVVASPFTVAQGGTGQSSLTPWTLLAGAPPARQRSSRSPPASSGQLLGSNGAVVAAHVPALAALGIAPVRLPGVHRHRAHVDRHRRAHPDRHAAQASRAFAGLRHVDHQRGGDDGPGERPGDRRDLPAGLRPVLDPGHRHQQRHLRPDLGRHRGHVAADEQHRHLPVQRPDVAVAG